MGRQRAGSSLARRGATDRRGAGQTPRSFTRGSAAGRPRGGRGAGSIGPGNQFAAGRGRGGVAGPGARPGDVAGRPRGVYGRHDGYGGRNYGYHRHGRRPAWAIYVGHYGLGIGFGYPGFGVYYGGPWGYGHYHDYSYAPGVYSDSVYYAPAIVDDAYETLELPVDPPPPDEQSARDGERFLVEAEAAFREGRYQDSVALTNHAMVEFPDDGRILLFLSQSLFAVGDYQAAITAAYHGMSLLDTEDWGYVVQNYEKYYGKDDYVSQMNKLNAYIKSNPEAAYARALRGYQFGYLGHEQQARKDLGKAIELENRDEFAARLVNQFGGHAELPPPEPPPEAAGAPEAGPSSEAATMPEDAVPDALDES